VLAALVAVSAALIGALGYESLAPSNRSLAATAPAPSPPGAAAAAVSSSDIDPPRSGRPPDPPRRYSPAPLGDDDGVVVGDVTVFDGEVPAVANLDPELLGALHRAATAAGRDGVTFTVTSGWRSLAYQAQLLREAVSTHGSEAEAARWVATPETSAHVSGDAVDLGSAASAWLAEHGAAYGLCPIYANEPWHHELRPDAIDHGCPARYADPTQDPRMQP
jgi:hypothetical protein